MARESKRKRDEKKFGRPERLADLIAAHGLGCQFDPNQHPEDYWLLVQHQKTIKEKIRRAVVIDCQNVVEYCDSIYTGKDVHYRDIPNWMPPFEISFFEWKSQGQARGVVCWIDRDGWLKETDLQSLPAGSSHVLVAYGFECGRTPSGDFKPYGPFGYAMAGLDSRGALMGDVSFGSPTPGDMGNTDAEHMATCVIPAFLATSFMHCKNVTVAAVDPDPGVNIIRERAGLVPFLRYHTINIDPMKSVLRGEGGVEVNGLTKALHICRGHFATYTEEKPLFGHFAGTVWKSQHIRGSSKNGVVVSDYNVNGPTATTGATQ